MSRTCEEHRADLVSNIAGELAMLEKARLDAHVAHCVECRSVHRMLSMGLSAARDVPAPSAAEIEQRVLEVQADPIVEISGFTVRPTQLRFTRVAFVAVPMALAASVAIIAVSGALRAPAPAPSVPVVAVTAPAISPPAESVQPAPSPAAVAPVEQQASAYVRLVHGEGFKGTVTERSAEDTLLVVDGGAVAVAFAGGQGRRLQVLAGDVAVEVTGTRFYVERKEDDRVVVAVRSGQVDVRVGGSTHTLSSTQAVQIVGTSVSGFALQDGAFAWTDRAFLRAGEQHAAAVAPVAVAARVAPAPVVSEAPREQNNGALLGLFADAEARVYAGDKDGARALYQRVAADPAFQSKRALTQFELGRFLAVVDEDRAAARPVLDELARGSSNVAGDAALLLCRLDEATDPCGADQCLAQVAHRGGDIGRAAVSLRTKLQLPQRCETQR